ncbi:MAG: alpha/beta hydrolase [Pirellulales bacterium]
MRSSFFTVFVCTICCCSALPAQDKATRTGKGYPPQLEGATVETYKTIGAGDEKVELKLWIYPAQNTKAAQSEKTPTPAIVFFFGGGWKNGSPTQFERHCKHFAARGIVAVAADYRVASRQDAKPAQCAADAKSCVRWLRANAARLNIDPQRIVAAGGSAGGHLAAATATLPTLDEPTEDAKISSRPNALVLFNPALITAPFPGVDLSGFASRATTAQLGAEPEAISPIHHVSQATPPTLILHGRADTTVPYRTVEAFAAEMKKHGARCDLIGYEGAGHGFFNRDKYDDTLNAADAFLVSLDYLPAQPAR